MLDSNMPTGTCCAANAARSVAGDERRDAIPLRALRADIASARVRWLSDWIDAHLAERISLRRLCELSGVGGRSLQKAFLSVHRTSPMGYVLARRLAAARALLTNECHEQGVTSVATACGFTHFGRFAARYGETFGESPSETLRRCRGASRLRSAAVEGGRRGTVATVPRARPEAAAQT
jgi:transcriptional regulator GlxA family with amidase domain